MVLEIRHSMGITLRPCWLSLESFVSLSSVEAEKWYFLCPCLCPCPCPELILLSLSSGLWLWALTIGISPILVEICFWNLLEIFLGCWSTFSKKFWIFCMSVSVLFGSLSYWNYTIIGISPVLDKISFWFFLETFLGCWYTCSK